MIYWAFLSPEAFIDLAQKVGEQNGLDDLKELLFPRRAEPNVLLADTHHDQWFQQVSKRAFQLPEKGRQNALALLMKIHDESLANLSSKQSVPTTEKQWMRLSEALVDQSFVADALLERDQVDHVNKLHDDAWVQDAFAGSGRIDRSLEPQRKIFKRLLWGSNWCLVTMPRVFGGSNDETVTLKQLVCVANEIACGERYEIDIVTGEFKGHQVNAVRNELRECQSPSSKTIIRVYSSAGTLDRNFYTGARVTIAGGEEIRRVGRGLFAQHVAIGRDRRGQSSNWAVLGRRAAEEQVNLLRDEIGEPVIVIGG